MKIITLITLITLFLIILIFISFKSNFAGNDKWLNYRLGDVYLSADDPKVVQNLDYHIKDYPGSIAAEIMKVKPYRRKNKELLLKIINDKPKYQFLDTDLVLHIRTGDVMCIEDKRFLWYSRKDDTTWWNKVADYIQKNKITKIYIVSGSHTQECNKESIQFLEDRKQFLSQLAEVKFHLGYSPDDDFIFCLSAKHFISTGGGFGRIIYEINNNWFN